MVAEKGHAAAAWAEAKSHFGQSKSRCGLLCAAAALQWPLRPITKPKRSGKKIEVTLLQHSFILLIIDF